MLAANDKSYEETKRLRSADSGIYENHVVFLHRSSQLEGIYENCETIYKRETQNTSGISSLCICDSGSDSESGICSFLGRYVYTCTYIIKKRKQLNHDRSALLDLQL